MNYVDGMLSLERKAGNMNVNRVSNLKQSKSKANTYIHCTANLDKDLRHYLSVLA